MELESEICVNVPVIKTTSGKDIKATGIKSLLMNDPQPKEDKAKIDIVLPKKRQSGEPLMPIQEENESKLAISSCSVDVDQLENMLDEIEKQRM